MTEDLKFLIKIVKKANKLITNDLQVFSKGKEGDIVTNFDLKIEAFITKKLKEKYPTFDIVSEEFNAEKKLTKNCFVIDPIDGTINFAHSYPFWSIQIACIKDSKTCAAVIYIPKLNNLYCADETGCYLNNKKIILNNSLSPEKCLYCIEGENKVQILEKIKLQKRFLRNTNSASVNFTFVANGIFGGTLFTWDSVWDYTPGLYIVKQAGGYIIDKKNAHVAANTKELAEILLESTK